jgi:conjugative transfer ATPase
MNFLKDKVKKSDIEKQYQSYSSISDKLPWLEWSDECNAVLLEDGHSVGALLEVRDIAAEAKPEEFIEKMHRSITKMFSTVVPLEDENPWVLQIYIQDDLTLNGLYKRLLEYTKERKMINDKFTRHYLSVVKRHFERMCKEEGMFTDPLSGLPFRAKTRRIRIAVYRRYSIIKKVKKEDESDVLAELETTIKKLISQLQQIGLKVRRLKARHFYDWLVRWFNPKPAKTNGDVNALLRKFSYPDKKPFGWNFTQNIFFGSVASYDEGWEFDGVKHKVLVFKDLNESVDIGVISRERNFGEGSKYALFDKFPAGSIYTIQIVFESKEHVKKHLQDLEKAAVGRGIIVAEITKNIERAYAEMENGNMLFRTVEAIYFRGNTDRELRDYETDITSLLNNSGLDVVATNQEIYPIDIYLRFLPFNFNYEFDKRHTYRSTYKYADDVVRLLPIYGRSRGDGINPLFVNFNRGGEPFVFDPLNKKFKMSNSHMAVIGTTGAGKSVLMNSVILPFSAIYNPRIIAIEVGGSFDLTAKYLKEHSRNVRAIKFDRTKPLAVNPYSEAYKALDQIEREERLLSRENAFTKRIEEEVIAKHTEKLNEEVNTIHEIASEAEQACDEDRDILNEMVLSTRIMITQGDTKEEEKIDLTDVTLINRSLIHAMKRCRDNSVSQMRVQHVAESFELLAAKEPNEKLKSRLTEFAMRLEYYVKDLLRSKFVNHDSEVLGDYDFLHIDFGFLKEQSYKDLMNIVCISMLSKVLALAEDNKNSGRPMILILDEAHVLFKSEMVAAFVTLMAKVARKVGLWLLPCTQNVRDFEGVESKKVLSMIETWLLLSLDAEEIKHVETFKPLTDEMRALVMDVRKYPGIYSEGVLLGKRYSGLFRNVPPRISLSLALTDPDERTARVRLQEEKGMTEMEAVEHIAKEMEEIRHEINEDTEFYD